MKKIIAAVLLTLGITIASAVPASADYSNNTVVNRSNGSVMVINDYGQYLQLIGYGSQARNIDWVVVYPGQCVAVSVYKYCVPSYGGNIRVAVRNDAQVTVNRLS